MKANNVPCLRAFLPESEMSEKERQDVYIKRFFFKTEILEPAQTSRILISVNWPNTSHGISTFKCYCSCLLCLC